VEMGGKNHVKNLAALGGQAVGSPCKAGSQKKSRSLGPSNVKHTITGIAANHQKWPKKKKKVEETRDPTQKTAPGRQT